MTIVWKCLVAQAVFVLLGIPTTNAMTWQITTVDSVDEVGRSSSIALDINRHPRISYVDDTNKDLKYASFNGSIWNITTVDSSSYVAYSSLELDSNDRPHIAYYDVSGGDLNYAHHNGSSWTTNTADSAGNVGAYPSLALDSNDRPHISYQDRTPKNLKYAYFNGSTWSNTTVDTGILFPNVGLHTSIALDHNDIPHISHWDQIDGALRYSTPNSTGTWLNYRLDWHGSAGSSSSIAIDSSGYPVVAYNESQLDRLKFASFDGINWSFTTVFDATPVTGGISLALDTNDYPHVSYWDDDNDLLKYAVFDGINWTFSIVDNIVDNLGQFTPGISLALDANDVPHISYYDVLNKDLKYATLIPEPTSLALVVATILLFATFRQRQQS